MMKRLRAIATFALPLLWLLVFVDGASAAVAVPSSAQATSTDAGGSGTPSVSVGAPSGIASGDTRIIACSLDAAAATSINVPSGYTAVSNALVGDPGYPIVRAFWKIAGGSEGSVSVSANGTGYILWCMSARITGAHASAPIGNVASTTPTGTATTLDAPDVTISNADSAAILIFGGSSVGASTITEPSGTTLLQEREAGVFPHGSVAYQLLAAGSYAPGNWTLNSSGDEGRIGQTFEILPAGAGASAPVLSSATPSGTLGTSTTATLGATTDQNTGTFYGVVGTGSQLTGVSASQIKAGQQASGSAALAACNATVSTTSPSCGVTGLTAATAYTYASIQNNTNGDSNIVTGTFTTAAASSALPIIHRQQAANDDEYERPLVANSR